MLPIVPGRSVISLSFPPETFSLFLSLRPDFLLAKAASFNTIAGLELKSVETGCDSDKLIVAFCEGCCWLLILSFAELVDYIKIDWIIGIAFPCRGLHWLDTLQQVWELHSVVLCALLHLIWRSLGVNAIQNNHTFWSCKCMWPHCICIPSTNLC